MAEVLEEHYTYKYILKLIKYFYVIVQTACCWFKEYIKAMTLNSGFKPFNTDNFLLYRVNELRTVISIIYVDDTL